MLQSAHSAGGFKNLTTAGKIGTGLAGAGVAVDAGSQFLNAFKARHNADKRSQDIGKGIGAGIGGGIGLWFGGPAGAAIGAQIGKVVGSWGGKAVNNFTKGWQRHKPPKRFWSLENLGWSTHDMFSKAGKWGSETGKNLVKGVKNGSKGFSKWMHDLPGNMHKGWKQGAEKSHKVMAKFWKDTGKGWGNFWKGVNNNRYVKAFKKGKFFQTALKDMKSRWHSFSKDFSKKWHSTWKSANSNRYAKAFKRGRFFSTALKDMRSRWNSFKGWLGKNWNNFWKSTNKWAKSSWDGTVRNWNGTWKKIKSGWSSFKGTLSSSWKSFWDGLTSNVKAFGKTVKDDFTGTINNIIGGFNDVVHALGGGKKTIGFLHFATGTDWKHKYPVPAILNDGHDSPQTHNRESIIHANGWWELLPDKANIKRWLLPDDEVVNARDTARIFGNAIHYASGSLPYGLTLPSVDYSQVEERALKRLQHINEEQLQLAKKEARRKQARDNKKDRQKKNSKKKHSKSENYSSDTRKVKGSILVDKGLLFGSRKEANKNTYVNEKLFKRLMSYTKAKPIKVSKNSRIRYRDLPTRRQGKYYLVDSKWLTGAKNNTGKLEKLDRESYLKLLQFTKAERKYKLPKKKRKTTRKRTTTRRTTTRRSTASRVRSAVSTGGYSVGRVSSAISSVSASVKGLGSVKALSKALKGIKGKHKVSVTAKASGSKSITKLAKSIKKVTGKHKVTIKTKGLSSLKSLYKAAKKIKGSTHKVRVKTSGTSSLKKLRSAISKVADESKKATKDIKGKGNFAKAFESLTKTTDKTLSKLRSNAEKDFKSMWSNLKKSTSSGVSKIDHDTSSFNSKFTRQWRSLTSGAERIFNNFWSTMKSKARSGLNDVISVLNSAIGKIDNVIGQFGGSKNAVHKVARLATGTGALGGVRRPITAPTLAILNDGNDSPETGNKEAIWDRNTGNVEVVPGRFTPRILKPGQEVFNATETAMLGYTTPQHFATGTGALKELYHIAKNNWEHPQKTGQALFSSINGLTGAINQLAQGAKDKGEDQGVKWWSQLWKMVDDKVNSDDLGPASGLLKAVEELGHGKRYLWGGYGLDSKGLDCSGLVSTALEHYFHSGWGHLDVAGLWQHAHRIPKSEAKPGDPVFWLPDEHVGVYAGHNLYYSAYGPNDGGPIGMQPVGSGATFGRFEGIKTDGAKNAKEAVKVKANNKLQKQIKKQVGPGFWKTIQKIADKFGEQFNGANSITGSMIEAAARKMHVTLPDGFVKDVLRVAMSESGNRNIQQQIHDVNSGGNEAQGPLQFTPQTFKAFAMPGHTNIHNPYDELLAFFNNSDWRNSIGWTTIWGHRKFDWLHSGPQGHRRFARGGILHQPETIDVAEGGHPESIIPWDPAYRGRAYQIMQATLDQFKAQDGNALKYQNQAQQAVDLTKTNAEIEAINDKFDQALAALGILTSQNDVIQVNNYLDKNKIGEAMFSVMKRLNMRSTRNSRYNISGH